jgi:hypothetical protein
MAPVFQPLLPHLNLSWRGTPLQIPLTQSLVVVVGVICYLCAYSLLYLRSGGKVSLKNNLLFMIFGFMITYGHGMHSVCVMVEAKGEDSVSPSMAAYVDFLHEVVSHNMFVCGMYAIMMLIMKAEIDSFDYKLQKKADKQETVSAKGHVAAAKNGSITNGTAASSKTTDLHKTAVLHKTGATMVQDFTLQWLWPVIVGMYFSIFSTMTGTVAITVIFYILVYMFAIHSRQKLHSCGISLVGFLDSDLLVWATVVKAASVGLPVLGLWFWSRH